MSEATKKFLSKANGLTTTLIITAVAIVISLIGYSCSPTTKSPMDPTREVNARDLNIEYQIWLAEQDVYQTKFKLAAEDIDSQVQQQTAIGKAIGDLAAGGVPNVPGLMQLLLGAGFTGLLIDNIRRPRAASKN